MGGPKEGKSPGVLIIKTRFLVGWGYPSYVVPNTTGSLPLQPRIALQGQHNTLEKSSPRNRVGSVLGAAALRVAS